MFIRFLQSFCIGGGQEAAVIEHTKYGFDHLSGFPHIPDRRDGESHANRVVDDIVTALTYLDEQHKLSLLPNYVADSPDSMP